VARDLRSRAAIIFGSALISGVVAIEQRAHTHMANPVEFINQVRSEANKVTWPTRRETMITTGLVLVMVLVASLFFVAVDQTLRLIVTFLLSLGH
jgi:preprotein translocase subunit SecE